MRRAPVFWQRPGLLGWALSPLGWLYAAGGMLRRWTTRPYDPALPVICVGNAVAGGAGKTPVVRALAAHLAGRGQLPVIVSRGYGGRLAGPCAVTPSHTAAEVGDEPRMLLRDAPVWIGADRAATVRAAASAHPGAVIVMDDGLQNPSVAKTLSLLVVDGEAGLGNGQLLPAGPLREPFACALRRADAVILLGADRHGIVRRAGSLPVFAATLEVRTALGAGRYLAFAGIGRPGKFFATLRAAGADLAGERAFPDHHPYSEAELLRLSRDAASLDARLVTTEKDAMRLPEAFRERIDVLAVDLVFAQPERFWDWLDGRLEAASRPALI